jgi:predicted RNA-binding protein with PUA-like domain
MPAHFLVKSEPSSYSFENLTRDGRTIWDGVRNLEARNNLRAMKRGDLLFYYHSGEGKEVVGVARVAAEARPDPTAKGEDWSIVDIEPVKPLAEPVTLAQMKADKQLADFVLLRRPRLSVVPVTPEQFAQILALGRTRL